MILYLKDDRVLHHDINKARDKILKKEVLSAVEYVIGKLSEF